MEQTLDIKKSKLILANLVIAVSAADSNNQHEACRNVGEELLNITLQDITDLTFSGLPNLIHSQETFESIDSDYIDISYAYISGSAKCKKGVSYKRRQSHPRRTQTHRRNRTHIDLLASPKKPLASAATCPWFYVLNTDPNRTPMSSAEVRCTCKRLHQPGLLCRPVKLYARDFRRDACQGGGFRYRPVREPVSVACVALVVPARPARDRHVRPEL